MGASTSKRGLARGPRSGDPDEKSAERKLLLKSDILLDYNRMTFEEIAECRDCFCDLHESSTFYLDQDEFEDVFSPIFDDCQMHHDLFEGRVFYVFAAGYLFAKKENHSFNTKIEMLFDLFDFDGTYAKRRNEERSDDTLHALRWSLSVPLSLLVPNSLHQQQQQQQQEISG